MSHYDNHIDDFGPQLPDSYEPGTYTGQRRAQQPYSYPAEEAGVPLSGTAPKVRIRRGGKAAQDPASLRKPAEKVRKVKADNRNKPQPQPTEDDTDMRSSGFVKFFTDRRTHKFFGLILVILSVFLAVITVSHLKNGAADQSMAMNSTVDQMAADGGTRNIGGPVGAKISYAIVTQWLGLGVIPFIAYFAVIGLSLLGIRKCRFWSATFQTLLLGITASVFLGLISANWATPFALGGEHGAFVNRFITQYAGMLGAVSVSLILLGAVFFVYYNYISAFFKARKAEYDVRRERRRQARLEMERQRAEAEAELARARSEMAEQQAQEGADELDIVEPEPASDTESDNGCITLDDIEENTEAEEPVSRKTEPAYEASENEGISGFTVDDVAEAEPEQEPVREETAKQIQNLPEVVEDNQQETDDQPEPAEPVQQTEQSLPEAPETPQPAQADEKPAALTPQNATLDVETNTIEAADTIIQEVYDPTAELSRYTMPPIDLLDEREDSDVDIDIEELDMNKQRIIKTLLEYNIPISDIKATVGPTITLFEIVPAEGVRIASIRRLEDDIARSLAAEGIRIVAPIPGRGTVGIEVPNHTKHTVSMRSVLTSKKYQQSKAALPIALGTTISNEVFIQDLAKMPHLLVAGATGQGKSVGLNAIIASLLYKRHPAEIKFVMVDPKMVEFSLYSQLEHHYLAKIEGDEDAIITDSEKVKATLNSLCLEMDNRYMLLKNAYVRSIEEYNNKFINHRLNPEKGHKFMPYIVVIVDEFADLIMMAGKDIELPIARIAQKARAVGIHLIIATQRPSTDVITGMIKANFPARMAFKVSQMVDSKTILDRPGANSLIGKGDMLFSANSVIERVQCAFISTEEVTRICDWIGSQPGYDSAYNLPENEPDEPDSGGMASGERDSLFEDCARFVVSTGTSSTSSLQRKFGIGYNRAGKIMDQMESAHIVGPANGGKPRAILVDMIGLEQMLEHN